jgi:crotonobetainyl-CoA:carnitine CoA-transferase CaiB-like acyl-CoA transferase
VIAAGGIVDMPAKTPGQTFRSPAGPARFVGADDGPKGPAPTLGQHTRDVLAGLGYSAAEIDGLIASSVVA